MAQVLSPIEPLRSSRDEFGLAATPTDWRSKYNEAADMLAEARNELDDFVHSSKELEEELLRELERTEKTQKDLKDKVSRAETDRDEWKNKYIQLQTTHNTTSNSLNRELDTLRKEHQELKIRYRDLEMGNDDLERTERAISVSLADVEAKYARVLEEKIILEQELLNKAKVEEEAQRLRDDMRDANSEIQVLRDQLDQYKANQSRHSLMTPPTTDSSCSPRHDNSSMVNLSSATQDDQLLDTAVPADVLLADETNPSSAPPLANSRPLSIASSSDSASTKGRTEKKPILPKPSFNVRATPSLGLHSRSNSLRASPNKAAAALPRAPRASGPRTSGGGSQLPSRSKGVQMVSEMRAKVRNLEQKLHTRVPRLRSGTFDRGGHGTSPNTAAKKPLQPDSPGWVLVMEESPPPRRVVPRRTNSPPPTAFPLSRSSNTSGNISSDAESPTVYRIPGPRRSFTKSVTSSTASSIPTPSTSRPSSPDFNPPTPIESRSLSALKRTSVPLFSGRTSLNSSTDSRDGGLNSSQRSTSTLRGQGTMAPPPPPTAKPLSSSQLGTGIGPGPRGLSVSTLGNPTLRQSQRSAATLGSSRIGRPLSMSARRTDTGPSSKTLPVDEYGMVIPQGKLRNQRSGSVSQFGAPGETF